MNPIQKIRKTLYDAIFNNKLQTEEGTAKPNCKKCFGRGFIGENLTFGGKEPCSCVKPRDSKGRIK
jgi:hypothetical protein